jgi:Holliday junction resolvasome RuvABC ATP-dependent DNA helicase subunit
MKIETIKNAVKEMLQPNLFVKLVTILWDAAMGVAPIQHVLLTGFAGLGKTRVANICMKLLEVAGFKSHNVSVGVTLSQFKSLMIQNCTSFANKNVFFLDEVQVLDKGLKTFLKQLLELGGERKTLTIHDSKGVEYELELSPSNFMVIMATNESLGDGALCGSSGRLTELKLMPYELDERVSIFTNMWAVYMPNEKMPTKEATLTYCKNVRPFARAIKKQIQDVRAQFITNELDVFSVEGARKALKSSGYYRDGWNTEHIAVLTFLATNASGRQVQEVAATPMQGATSKEAKEVLDELRQADFVLNTNQSRKAASTAGVAYLQSLTAKKTVAVVTA